MINIAETTNRHLDTKEDRNRYIRYMTIGALAATAFLGAMFYKDHHGGRHEHRGKATATLVKPNPQHSGLYSGEVRTLDPNSADAREHPEYYRALARIQDSIKGR